MRLADRPGESHLIRRRQDQVDVVRHQAIGPALDAISLQLHGQQVEIDLLVAGFEENSLPPVAALSDTVRHAGNDHTSKAGHSHSIWGCQDNNDDA